MESYYHHHQFNAPYKKSLWELQLYLVKVKEDSLKLLSFFGMVTIKPNTTESMFYNFGKLLVFTNTLPLMKSVSKEKSLNNWFIELFKTMSSLIGWLNNLPRLLLKMDQMMSQSCNLLVGFIPWDFIVAKHKRNGFLLKMLKLF